jgi:hypothetical protein
MHPWLQDAIALAALGVLAPVVAWVAKRYGRRAKGGLMLAGILLGIGQPIDPPTRHLIEAEPEDRESPAPGDPPVPGRRGRRGVG